MKQEFILDPLWITKGNYLDSEYFNYILLDASVKYKKEIESGEIDHFYEVMFHSLNLNNLAVNGNLCTAKFKQVWKNERIIEINNELKKLYDLPQETASIFKNANYVFLNILIDYLKIHLSVIDNVHIFHANPRIHLEKEIFIITNILNSSEYQIWSLTEDPKCNFGYSFKKIRKVKVKELKPDALQHALDELDDPRLKKVSAKKNACFVVYDFSLNGKLVAKTIKDTILLNKGMAKTIGFEPYIMVELYHHVWIEKIMPFTLDQWKFEKC